jgi:hypothetical protein
MPIEQIHQVIDLVDVVKGRVAAGEPVYLTGNPPGVVVDAVTAMAEQVAAETGLPARVIQVVELPSLPSGQ